MVRKLVGWVREEVGRLATLRDRPHAIAGGIAIGVFFGFVPLFGLKTLLTLGTAWVLRCNKIAAVIVVSLHDLLTPFLPLLLRFEYDIGYWVMSKPHHLPPELHMSAVSHPLQFLHWTFFLEVGVPLLIGGLAIGTPLSVVAYFVSHGLLRLRERRMARREAESAPTPGGAAEEAKEKPGQDDTRG